MQKTFVLVILYKYNKRILNLYIYLFKNIILFIYVTVYCNIIECQSQTISTTKTNLVFELFDRWHSKEKNDHTIINNGRL